MLKSYINQVIKDLETTEKKRLVEAARHVKAKLKENVSKVHHKFTGDLIKGIDYKPLDHAVLVGYGPPAYHAHLLEFGTVNRTVKNYLGAPGVEVKVGHIKPTPVIFPTFEEEAGAVENILSKQWA
jgi:HK97 gp10 family phage protein